MYTAKITALLLLAALALSYAFVKSADAKPAALAGEIYDSNTAPDQPEELGKVRWLRDFDKATALAAKEEKPVLILFQEVPGCSTCRNYGNDALSHPLLVEAMETLFVPLAIFNNKGGKDKEVLEFYGEPTWNNPVVRIVGADKKNLIARVNGNYSAHGLADAMLRALDAVGTVAPAWLELLEDELAAEKKGTKTATFGMYCFWSGEREIGALDGVTQTKPGFMGGREVVRVEYDPTVIAFDDLAEKAKNAQCNSHVYTDDASDKKAAAKLVGNTNISPESKFRLDADVKYYLSKTPYRFVPMTEAQAAKVNSRIGRGQAFADLLSPRQKEIAAAVKKDAKGQENLIGVPIERAWSF